MSKLDKLEADVKAIQRDMNKAYGRIDKTRRELKTFEQDFNARVEAVKKSLPIKHKRRP